MGAEKTNKFRQIYKRITVMIHVIRDYHMGFWLSSAVSTRDSIISPRALADILILVFLHTPVLQDESLQVIM